jgi:hypothetical protein
MISGKRNNDLKRVGIIQKAMKSNHSAYLRHTIRKAEIIHNHKEIMKLKRMEDHYRTSDQWEEIRHVSHLCSNQLQVTVLISNPFIQMNPGPIPGSVTSTQLSLEPLPTINQMHISSTPTKVTTSIDPFKMTILICQDLVERNGRHFLLAINSSTLGNEIIITIQTNSARRRGEIAGKLSPAVMRLLLDWMFNRLLNWCWRFVVVFLPFVLEFVARVCPTKGSYNAMMQFMTGVAT